MSKEINFDTMTDEDVEAILNQIDAGTFETDNSGSDDTDTTDDNSDTTDTTDDNDNGNLEDTEDETEDEDDLETKDQDDDSDADTNDETSDAGTENSQVEKTETDNKTTTDTDSTEDAKTTETGKIDPAEYERLKNFYETIANAEFVANGKKVKGFTDPEKIIRSQQMAYGYSDKMRGFNEYRPFLKALKDKGLMSDESKFNFAMSLIDGDKAAIKQHLKTLNLDPVELEMDETAYAGRNYVASKESLILEDTLATARETGIEDKLRKTIGEQWDESSFKEFVENPAVRADLLEHMQSGAFDIIQSKVAEMELLDTYGTFTSLKSTDKYRRAVAEVNREAQMRQPQYTQQSSEPAKVQASNDSNRVDALLKQQEEARAKAAQEAAYKANVQKKNMEADEARRKAAELSKKKTVVTKTKKFDPLALDGDELSSFVDGLISGNIK